MSWLQIGAAKSGNYWLHKILTSIRKEYELPVSGYITSQSIYPAAKEWPLSFPEQASVDNAMVSKSTISYRISSIFQMPVTDLREYASKASVIWLQSPYQELTEKLFDVCDKIVYIIRDPRDIIFSNISYQNTEYRKTFYAHNQSSDDAYQKSQYMPICIDWAGHIAGYWQPLQKRMAHVVFYEQLLSDPDREISRLIRYLGLEPDDKKIKSVIEASSFDEMKKNNPTHLRSGQSGGWKEKLNSTQKNKIRLFLGPLLDYFGYSEGGKNPSVPGRPAVKALNQIRKRIKLFRVLKKLKLA